MNKEEVLGIVRHSLTFIGGLLTTKGYIDESMAGELIGLGITVFGIIWSIYEKRTRKV